MNKVQIQIIKEALEQPDKLSDWEYDFIDAASNVAKEDDDYVFTEKQNHILNRIGGSKMA